MSTKKTIRITFRGPETDALSRVTASMNEPSEQDAIRTLVKREDDKRSTKTLMYGKSEPVPRETKAERMRRLMALDDAALAETLGPLLDEEFRKAPDDKISIETNATTGMRMVRVKSPSTGMNDEIGLDYYLKRWEAEKRLPV